MVPPSSAWYPILDTLADSIDPILAFMAIIATIQMWRRTSPRAAVRYAMATLAGLAAIYLIQAIDTSRSIWRTWGGDYSTHAAFAASVTVSLFFAFRHPALLTAVMLGYLALMVVMGYHSLADVLTASVVACAVTLPCHLIARRSPPPTCH